MGELPWVTRFNNLMGNKASSISEPDMPSSPAEPDFLDGIFAVRHCQPNMAIPSAQSSGTVSKVYSKPTEMSADRSNSGPARPRNKKDPLQLLDLPLDILKDIVREVIASPPQQELNPIMLDRSHIRTILPRSL